MRLLFLDDLRARHDLLHLAIERDQIDVTVVPAFTATQAIKLLQNEPRFDIVSLDYQLGKFTDETGGDVARYIAEFLDEAKRPARINMHSGDDDGCRAMHAILHARGITPQWQTFLISDPARFLR